MENRADITLAEQFAAAQDWWRDAGVDMEFRDEVIPWLTDAEAAQAAAAPAAASLPAEKPAPPAHEPLLRAADLPQTLDDLREWWASAANPFALPSGPNLAPRGEAGARLLLLVPMPEAGDREALLGGTQGRILANMLHALGLDPAQAMVASALPAHQPLPSWDSLTLDGLGLALHHLVHVAQPQRVIVLGNKLPQLFGHDPAAPPESFAKLGEVPVLTTFAPERLLDHPRQRARLWWRLLEWTASA